MEFILLLYLFYQLKDHIENNGNQDSMTLLSFIKYLFSSIHFDYFFRFLGMKISLSSVSKYDEDEESEVQLYMSFVFSSTMDCSSSSLLQILKDLQQLLFLRQMLQLLLRFFSISQRQLLLLN